MTTSIMMVTYNRLELTKRMLTSLFENTDGSYRLIIVDNGSTDGTIEYLQNLKQNNEIVSELQLNPVNQGIAHGRNQCLLLANKYNDEWLSTVDNDVEFHKGWLSEALDIISANPNFAIGLNMEGRAYPLQTRNGKTFQVKPEGNLGTACTVFNRKLHDKIGFFTTEYGLYGEEDADFFFRARLVGYQMGYLPKMGIHLGEGENDVGAYREFKTESHAKNLIPFRKRCGDYVMRRKNLYISYPV